ncbi:MAG TPA: hypothetical protein VMH27_14885 [Puia sp.]|nr:hypothetical protein [Puia sp.]
MKIALKVAAMLSWFNIIFWGMFVALGLLVSLATGQMALLALFVLLSAIPLNCFAALKLHKSIRYSREPLSNQTPVGIRFVGLIALFFGMMDIISGFSTIADPGRIANMMKELAAQMPDDLRKYYTLSKGAILFVGSLSVALGLMIAVNVILNIRLLRWYFLVHRNDVS